MVGSRIATAVVGIVASLLVSAAAWHYFDAVFLFLLVPFVPLLLRGRGGDDGPPRRECPTCDFATRDPDYRYCPRDGSRLG